MQTIILLVIAFVSVGASLIISIVTGDWAWFSRSGSIMTFSAIMLSMIPVIREAGVRSSGSAIPTHSGEDQTINRNSISWGFGLLAVGTIVWGYGDLLGNLFTSQ